MFLEYGMTKTVGYWFRYAFLFVNEPNARFGETTEITIRAEAALNMGRPRVPVIAKRCSSDFFKMALGWYLPNGDYFTALSKRIGLVGPGQRVENGRPVDRAVGQCRQRRRVECARSKQCPCMLAQAVALESGELQEPRPEFRRH